MIYLDNSATTKPSENVKTAVNYVLDSCWGNPSSLHGLGFDAEKLIKRARISISEILKCSSDEIFFTSGGTESNNLAIHGVLSRFKNKNKKIITTSMEHKSVLDMFKGFEKYFEVIYVKPNLMGDILIEDVVKHIDERTVMLSVMQVNNETGSIFDVETIARRAKDVNNKVIVHCDGVQGFCKKNINLNKVDIDIYTFSGHKIHAPKGIGGLYIKNKTNITPLIVGGGQQKNVRAGTENTAFINALGVASVDSFQNNKENLKKVDGIKEYLIEQLHTLNYIDILEPIQHFSYIINVWVKGIKSETLLHFLESKDIYVSSGSACSKGNVSYVLKQLKDGDKRADESIRISLSKDNTFKDIDELVIGIKEANDTLKRVKR